VVLHCHSVGVAAELDISIIQGGRRDRKREPPVTTQRVFVGVCLHAGAVGAPVEWKFQKGVQEALPKQRNKTPYEEDGMT